MKFDHSWRLNPSWCCGSVWCNKASTVTNDFLLCYSGGVQVTSPNSGGYREGSRFIIQRSPRKNGCILKLTGSSECCALWHTDEVGAFSHSTEDKMNTDPDLEVFSYFDDEKWKRKAHISMNKQTSLDEEKVWLLSMTVLCLASIMTKFAC